MREIPQHESHDETIGAPEVDAGWPAAADNRGGEPVARTSRTFVSREALKRLLGDLAHDRGVARDIDSASGDTVDAL
jgi:hypothetical protein